MDRAALGRILHGHEKPKMLPLALLMDITKSFSFDQEIGRGGYATVYKGELPIGNVAVKRMSHLTKEAVFQGEVDILLNTIEHKNVVRFLGYCASTDQTAIKMEGSKKHTYADVPERLLCFEYISNGSLRNYITDELRGLEWDTRYGIIRGICEGLHHLHVENEIFHMDLKPENILLDNDMLPKITDFGLSILDGKSETISGDRHGTLGYIAPEYHFHGERTSKSDVYSLGVIIIELVTGEKRISNDKDNVLRRWRHRWTKSGKGTPLVYQQVAKCLEIGFCCQENDLSKRPSIQEIMHDITQMEGVNGITSNDCEYNFGQISPYSEDDMLGIEPVELHFPFQLNKRMTCVVQLINKTDYFIAFNVEHVTPRSYSAQPQEHIMPPRSKYTIKITVQPQGKAPRYRTHGFTVRSTKVNDGLAIEDITANMLSKEAMNVVDEVNLYMVFDAIETTPALRQIIDDADGKINCIDANQIEPWIIIGRQHGCVQIWNYDMQKVISSINVSASAAGVADVKFIARKEWFVAMTTDYCINVCKYEKKMENVRSFRGADNLGPGAWCSLAVHPTQPYVLSVLGAEIKLWDWDQAWNLKQTSEKASKRIYDVKFNPEDTNIIASASGDHSVKVWYLAPLSVKCTLSGHTSDVRSLDFFPHDGQQHLITGSKDKTAKIWDMEEEKCVQTLDHESAVYSVLSHPSLPVLITGTWDGAVRVWSSIDFRLRTKLQLGHGDWVAGFACLMGSGRVAVARKEGVSVMEICDEEEQGGSTDSKKISIPAAD